MAMRDPATWAAYMRGWRAKNIERARENSRSWRAENLERAREISRKGNAKYRAAGKRNVKAENATPAAIARKSRWLAMNPDKRRATLLKSHGYDITLAQYKALLVIQQCRCAICRADKPGGKGVWHVDHDHATNKVRGLLCHGCNTGLGSMRDNLETLERAAQYLREAAACEHGRAAVVLAMFDGLVEQ